jgi:hypothetical protein
MTKVMRRPYKWGSPVPKALSMQTFGAPTITSPMKSFRTPFIPHYLKAKKIKKASAPKNRKRTIWEELD